MPDVSVFNLSGTAINVKDATQKTASAASSTASEALDLAKKIENLSKVEINYTDSPETITVTTGTHTPASEV